mmetsp:Transcript_2065/g.3316  ORF Transcript_2065/g.3316 Transcript_2065/m.3316 type:complete len:97 (+) Transcript_2065:197-487(+)
MGTPFMGYPLFFVLGLVLLNVLFLRFCYQKEENRMIAGPEGGVVIIIVFLFFFFLRSMYKHTVEKIAHNYDDTTDHSEGSCFFFLSLISAAELSIK